MPEAAPQPEQSSLRQFRPGSVFVGRQREMAELRAALDDTLAGHGHLVMLAGEPGIGKTRTAQELAALAEEGGAKALWGWCYEHRGAPPYWPWLQCIRAYVESVDPAQLRQEMGPGAADISEILPELGVKLEDLERPQALDPEEARFRLFFSIATFLKNVSRSQPLVLVLDDLHWADESSLLLLEFLVREISQSPVMVLGAYRDIEATGSSPLAQTLGSLVREEHFQRIQLGGLSRQDVGEFVEARAGITVADATIDTLHQRTEGNPLFVGEVVGSVGPEEMARDQTWITNIPEAVREAILRRLSRLSQACNQLLRTASVIGRDFDLPSLRDLSPDLAEDAFLESLDEALSIRIIESLPAGLGGFRFGHALIQQALYEEIPAMRKAQAHAATGETLEQLHQNSLEEHAGELAYHFGEAGAVSGTDKMVRYSLLAGQRAVESFAYEQALVHFDRVLAAKAGPEVDTETAAALFGLARAQVATLPRHEIGQAHLNLSRAFDYYVSVGDTGNIVAISVLPFPNLSEHRIPRDRLVTRALELVPDDSLEAGRLYSFHGRVQGIRDGDYQSARLSFDRALAIARLAGDTVLEMRTLGSAAQVEMWHNHFEDSRRSGLMAIDLAIEASDPRGEVDARYWAALASRTLGDFEGLRLQCLAMLDPAERLRDRYWLATAHSIVAYLGFSHGEWQSAREATQRGLDLMPQDPRILMYRVFLDIQTGDQDQAELHLERLEEVVRQSQAGPTTANACLALMSPLARSIFGVVKRPDLGEASINAVLSSPSVTPYFSTWARIGASLLAVMNDDSEAAKEQYAALRPSAGIVIYVNVDRILGLLVRTSGNLGQAAAHFEDALTFCRNAGYRPELAWTCLDYADTLIESAAQGDRAKASALLEESLAQATELGMRPLMERASERLERIQTQPERTSPYPDGITQRESEVLRLVASGKTDREIAEELIISINTVGNHVRSILNKTMSANRTEAAAYAALRGLTGDAGDSSNIG